MSDLKSRLEKAFEFNESIDSTDGDDASIVYIYEPRIRPIITELLNCVEALEFMTMPITAKTITIEDLTEAVSVDERRGKNALARLEKVIGAE